MTDSITPALSADEWARVRAYTEANYSVFTGDWMLTAFLGMDYHDARHAGLPEHSPTDPQPDILMALANAALPDTDPRKITRADVETVIDGALQATDEFPLDPEAMELESKLRAVAAKLAALLPPE